MASKDSKEQLNSVSQTEDAKNDVYDDATLITSEKKGGNFLIVVEDDKMNERVENEDVETDEKSEAAIASTADAAALSTVETSKTVVGGQGTADEGGEKGVENAKVEASNSASKEVKRVVRKRKKTADEISAQAVSSPSKVLKKKLNDTSAVKIIEEAPTCDKSNEGNAKKELKSDGKVESVAIPGEKEKSANEAKKVVKKVVKKKIVPADEVTISNSDSALTKSANATSVAPTSSVPAVKKDIEGTKDNSSIDAGKLNSADKPSPSATEKPTKKPDDKEKQSKKVDGMGLIFICNARTKKDCFKYNVLGLPKSKKDLVAKIYKGMRLFLFDVDLKLMYGIYKAAGPGGYNLEPKAFDSKFPSQVRFSVLKDCLPLPEEKFKAAIKENYFKRNQFDSKLSAEQVRKLCKLYQSAPGNASKQTQVSARESNRRPVGRYAREAYLSPPRARYHSPPRGRYLSPPAPRSRYLSPPPRSFPIQAIPRALPPPYAYEQAADEYYRRDRPRALEPLEYQDPYLLYREPALYPESAYPPLPPAYAASRLRQPRSPPRYLY